MSTFQSGDKVADMVNALHSKNGGKTAAQILSDFGTFSPEETKRICEAFEDKPVLFTGHKPSPEDDDPLNDNYSGYTDLIAQLRRLDVVVVRLDGDALFDYDQPSYESLFRGVQFNYDKVVEEMHRYGTHPENGVLLGDCEADDRNLVTRSKLYLYGDAYDDGSYFVVGVWPGIDFYLSKPDETTGEQTLSIELTLYTDATFDHDDELMFTCLEQCRSWVVIEDAKQFVGEDGVFRVSPRS